MPLPQCYSFALVAASIRARLVVATGLDDSFVRLVGSDSYRYSREEVEMIALRPLGPRPFTDAGAGRKARPTYRTVRIYTSIRSSVDRVGEDRNALAKLWGYEDAVNNYLDDWYPLDATASFPLTIEPLHPTDSQGRPAYREADADGGEILSCLEFEVVYLQPNAVGAP